MYWSVEDLQKKSRKELIEIVKKYNEGVKSKLIEKFSNLKSEELIKLIISKNENRGKHFIKDKPKQTPASPPTKKVVLQGGERGNKKTYSETGVQRKTIKGVKVRSMGVGFKRKAENFNSSDSMKNIELTIVDGKYKQPRGRKPVGAVEWDKDLGVWWIKDDTPEMGKKDPKRAGLPAQRVDREVKRDMDDILESIMEDDGAVPDDEEEQEIEVVRFPVEGDNVTLGGVPVSPKRYLLDEKTNKIYDKSSFVLLGNYIPRKNKIEMI